MMTNDLVKELPDKWTDSIDKLVNRAYFMTNDNSSTSVMFKFAEDYSKSKDKIEQSISSSGLEELHSQVHKNIESAIGDSIQKREVYPITGNDVGVSLDSMGIIYLNVNVCDMNENYDGFLQFKKDNHPVNVTPKDYFNIALAHEYGHQIFHDRYKSSVNKIVTDRKLQKSITESFAFWFGEQITGLKQLTPDLAAKYENELDVSTMMSVYSQLKESSNIHGTKYVMNNFIDIVTDSLQTK